jgi:hypothetical protein
VSCKKKMMPYVMLVSGGLMAILGIAFVAMYILDAVVARAGEPDQSLLFWYLPILFFGVIAMLIGAGISAWEVSRVRKMRSKKI